MSGKKIEIEFERDITQGKFLNSYSGTPLESQTIHIGIYDKDCSSSSCVEIRVEEISTKGNRKIVIIALPKNKVLELKEALNALTF